MYVVYGLQIARGRETVGGGDVVGDGGIQTHVL